jgi:hypothetical protein
MTTESIDVPLDLADTGARSASQISFACGALLKRFHSDWIDYHQLNGASCTVLEAESAHSNI